HHLAYASRLLQMLLLPAHAYTPSFLQRSPAPRDLHSFPTRRSSDLTLPKKWHGSTVTTASPAPWYGARPSGAATTSSSCWSSVRSEEHTSELQSRFDLVCRLLLEKKKPKRRRPGLQKKAAERRTRGS